MHKGGTCQVYKALYCFSSLLKTANLCHLLIVTIIPLPSNLSRPLHLPRSESFYLGVSLGNFFFFILPRLPLLLLLIPLLFFDEFNARSSSHAFVLSLFSSPLSLSLSLSIGLRTYEPRVRSAVHANATLHFSLPVCSDQD